MHDNKVQKLSSENNIVKTGPGIWYTLHTMAAQANGPVKRQKVRQYMNKLTETLPCPRCRGHLADFINKTRDVRLCTAEETLFYTYYLHNLVNARLKKRQPAWEDVRNMYMDHTDSCEETCPAN